jgi:hypothetical protein
LPTELRKLQALVAKGLAATDAMWPAIRVAYDWVHRAARLLENEDELTGAEVRQRMDDLLAEIRDDQATVGTLQPALAHCLKVSASYWPGLFHCYDIPGLPRTNNALEQFFGSVRYHHRRASGRIRASAATVVRGSVRALASTVSRHHLFGEYDLRHPNLAQPGPVARLAPFPRTAPGGATTTGPLPQRSRRLLGHAGEHATQAEFAVLEKTPSRTLSGRAFPIWSGRDDLNLRPPEPH